MSHLTRRQQAIYEFILEEVSVRGMPPTLMEIASAFGLTSAAGVSDHLKAIERKGYIRRRPGVSRGIELPTGDVHETPKARSVPLLGRAPSDHGVQRGSAPRVAVDCRWAGRSAVAFEVATSELSELGILPGDLLITDSDADVGAGDLVIGRQASHVAILRIGRDGRTARSLVGLIDPSADVRAYGRVVAVLRVPERHLSASSTATRGRIQP